MPLLQALRFALAIDKARKRGLLLGVIALKTGHVDIAVLDRIGDLAIYRRGRNILCWRIGTTYSLAGAQCIIAHESAASTLDEGGFAAAGMAGADAVDLERMVNDHVKAHWALRWCQQCESYSRREVCETCGGKTVSVPPPYIRVRSLDDAVAAARLIEDLGLPPLDLKVQPLSLRSDVLARFNQFTAADLGALQIVAFAALSSQLEGARRMLMGRVSLKALLLLVFIVVIVVGALFMLLGRAGGAAAPVRVP
ncbi:MAG: hypothetical protein QXT28_12275 [Thermofilaceae archaeon]